MAQVVDFCVGRYMVHMSDDGMQYPRAAHSISIMGFEDEAERF